VSSSASVAPWADVPPSEDSAFVRLWRGFATARVCIAAVLLFLLATMGLFGSVPSITTWVVGLCIAYLAATLAVRVFITPSIPGQPFDPQWVPSIGVDLLMFSAMQMLQAGNLNYTPLFAVPVLMASVLGSALLALGTAAAVALLLLAEAWIIGLQLPAETAARFLQAGLTGTGYFTVAFLANQLAVRLAREEKSARKSQKAAFVQAQVNELVIETLTDGVLVVDPDSEVRTLNPAARELLGHRRTTVASGHFLLLDEAAWYPLVQMAQMTFFTGSPQASDIVIEEPGMAPRRISARTRLTAGDDPASDSLCVIFLQDLRQLESRLRTEKLAAMGRMSTAVAHEIRNPLAAITQANALLEEELQDAGQRQLSGLVAQNAHRLALIVEEILDIARVQHQAPSDSAAPFPLDASVESTCLDWSRQNRCTAQLHTSLRASAAMVSFEPDHLRRVLVNLLDNALRYASAEPGSIQVATTPDGAQLSVWSDGQPLAPGVQHHLFEPFFSSESRSTGLGLFICRELCQRHGARIGYRRAAAPDGSGRAGNEFLVGFRRRPGHSPGTAAFDTIAA
jgi:two-component system sensor histidine kinase PilS (NtrC family)